MSRRFDLVLHGLSRIWKSCLEVVFEVVCEDIDSQHAISHLGLVSSIFLAFRFALVILSNLPGLKIGSNPACRSQNGLP